MKKQMGSIDDLKHVFYEILMFVEINKELDSNNMVNNDCISNSLKEALLLHHRNLTVFFASNGKSDELKVNEFCQIKGLSVDKGKIKKINLLCTHLQRGRNDYVGEIPNIYDLIDKKLVNEKIQEFCCLIEKTDYYSDPIISGNIKKIRGIDLSSSSVYCPATVNLTS